MNKMAKGAIATAAGVVLLIGGGGTLALWSSTDSSVPGTITSGNLNVDAGPGTWYAKSANGDLSEIPTIGSYRVVPGEVLVYKQELDIVLTGDHMAAKLTTLEDVDTTFSKDSYSTKITLLDAKGVAIPVEGMSNSYLDSSASIEFVFKDVAGRTDVGASYNFEEVGFLLEQVPHATHQTSTSEEAPEL